MADLSDVNRIEEYKRNTVSLNSQFRFECQMCGSCCKNRSEAILITGVDIFYASKELGISILDFMDRYTVRYIGGISRLPVAVLREKINGECSLMENNKCSIQNNKPGACAIYPLGRMQEYNGEFVYFTQPNSCPGCLSKKRQTVRDWLQKHNMISKEAEVKAWNKLVLMFSKMLIKNDIRLKPGDVMSQLIVTLLYLGYDTSKPLLAQIEEYIEEAKELFKDEMTEEEL